MAIAPFALLVVVLFGAVLATLWIRVLRRPKSDLPTCGACGYGVRGVSSLRCPECGADLREVGIITPGRQGTVTPVIFTVIWTVCYLILALFVGGLLIAMGPRIRSMVYELSLRPISNAFHEIEITFDYSHTSSAWGRRASLNSGGGTSSHSSGSMTTTTIGFAQPSLGARLKAIQLVAQPTPQVARTVETLHVRPALDGYRYANVAGTGVSESKPLDAGAIVGWFQESGVAPHPQLDADATAILQLLTAHTDGQPQFTTTRFKSPGSARRGRTTPVTWYPPLVVLLLLSGFVAGFVVYFRARRRRLAPI